MLRCRLSSVLFAVTVGLTAAAAAPSSAAPPEKLDDGIIVPLNGGFLKVEVRADDVVRVAYARERDFFSHASLVVLPGAAPATSWLLTTTEREAQLATAHLRVRVDLVTGAVSFHDRDNRPILYEKADGRRLEPAEVQGEQTFHVRQQWQAN